MHWFRLSKNESSRNAPNWRLNAQRLPLLSFLLISMVVRGQQLEPHVQADLLKTEILNAYADGRASDLLGLVDKYDQLLEKGVVLAPPIRFIEAKSASSLELHTRAFCALTEFLNTADKTERSYSEGLSLYSAYASAAQTSGKDFSCAVRPVPEKDIPAEGPQSNTKMATVIFFRPAKFAGSGELLRVRDASRSLGQISSGKYFTVELPPGKYQFFIKTGIDNPDEDVLDLEIKAGETYYIKGWNKASAALFLGGGFYPHMELSSKEAFEAAKR